MKKEDKQKIEEYIKSRIKYQEITHEDNSMTIQEYLDEHPEIDRNEFLKKIHKYDDRYNEPYTETDCLMNFMAYIDKPFCEVMHLYDIAYARMEYMHDDYYMYDVYEFMYETPYSKAFSEWLESEEAENWYMDKEKMHDIKDIIDKMSEDQLSNLTQDFAKDLS